jgi:hypothetical protein
MSANDSPRDLRDLGDSPSDPTEREQRVWWDYLTICGGIHLAIVSSPYKRNPQIPTCVLRDRGLRVQSSYSTGFSGHSDVLYTGLNHESEMRFN